MTSAIAQPNYQERVFPGVSFFLAGLVLPVSFYLIMFGLYEPAAIAALVFGFLCIGLIAWRSSHRIAISSNILQVGNAQLAREFVSSVEVINPVDLFRERGTNLDPKAYTKFQVGVKGMIKISLNDPADPTPYWLVATRNPELISKYLQA